MTSRRPFRCLTILASAAFAAALVSPSAAQLSPQENPFSGVSAGAWVAAPVSDREAMWHNFAAQYKNSQYLKESFEGQDMIAAGGGRAYPVDLTFHLDRSVDAIPLIAKLAQPQYFPNEPLASVEADLRSRVRDYDAAMTSQNMHALNVANGCDYFVEGLYASGSGIEVGTAGRRNIRGACILFMAFLEQHGRYQKNVQRQALTQYFAAAGGTYRSAPAKFADDARSAFRTLFAADISALPPERLPCAFATPKESCARIMSEDVPKLDRLIAKFG